MWVKVALLTSQHSLFRYFHVVIKRKVAACFLRFLGSARLPIFIWAFSCLLSLLSLSPSILLLTLAVSFPCRILSWQEPYGQSWKFTKAKMFHLFQAACKTPPNFCCFLKLTHEHLPTGYYGVLSFCSIKSPLLCFLLHRRQFHAGGVTLSLPTCILGFLEILCHLVLL